MPYWETNAVYFASYEMGEWKRIRKELNGRIHQMLLGWPNKKNGMGRAHGSYGGEERCIQGYGGKTWGKRNHMEDQGVDRIILKWIFQEVGWVQRLDWSGSGYRQMAGSCDTVMNIRVTYSARNLLTEDLIASQGHCSVELNIKC